MTWILFGLRPWYGVVDDFLNLLVDHVCGCQCEFRGFIVRLGRVDVAYGPHEGGPVGELMLALGGEGWFLDV